MSAFGAGANCYLVSPLKEKTMGPNPSTSRGTTLHINGHPKESRIIYPSGKYIVVKNLNDPSDCFIYRGHTVPTTVAKFSPNGYWVASADSSGKVRVWSWDNPEHLLKMESQAMGGPVMDIDWDFESKKIVVCGESGGMMIKCMTWDTGNSVGEMTGHTKRVMSVSYKPTRPFRILSGSEDFRSLHYQGPPFKLEHSNSCHSNFVNCIRYSPDGSKAVSVGSDKKIQFYDGATGQPTTEVVNAHAGTISSVTWSPDSTQIVTASADKTAKRWDVASSTCVQTYTFSDKPQVSDMLVSVLWTAAAAGGKLVVVTLNGDIHVLPTEAAGAATTLQSHQVAITSMYYDTANRMLYTGSFDGVVCVRDLQPAGASSGSSSAAVVTKVLGTDLKHLSCGLHSGKVTGLTTMLDVEDRSKAVLQSVGWDDMLRQADSSVALAGQPCAMVSSSHHRLSVVVTNNDLLLFDHTGKKVGGLGINGNGVALTYVPQCVAVRSVTPDEGSNQMEIAVGGDDNKTHIYKVDLMITGAGTPLMKVFQATVSPEFQVIETRSAVSALAYSPAVNSSGEVGPLSLAIGDAGRQVEVYDASTWSPIVKGKWVFHTSKITCLAWSADGMYLASGSLDESIIVWSRAAPNTKTQVSYAHVSGVTGIAFIDSKEGKHHLVSAGNDHVVVTWNM